METQRTAIAPRIDPGFTRDEVATRYHLKEGTIRKRIAQRRFPPANVWLGAHTLRWTEEYLLAWESNVGHGSNGQLNAAMFARDWFRGLTTEQRIVLDPDGLLRARIEELIG